MKVLVALLTVTALCLVGGIALVVFISDVDKPAEQQRFVDPLLLEMSPPFLHPDPTVKPFGYILTTVEYAPSDATAPRLTLHQFAEREEIQIERSESITWTIYYDRPSLVYSSEFRCRDRIFNAFLRWDSPPDDVQTERQIREVTEELSDLCQE